MKMKRARMCDWTGSKIAQPGLGGWSQARLAGKHQARLSNTRWDLFAKSVLQDATAVYST